MKWHICILGIRKPGFQSATAHVPPDLDVAQGVSRAKNVDAESGMTRERDLNGKVVERRKNKI
jgi:hypothetical protein